MQKNTDKPAAHLVSSAAASGRDITPAAVERRARDLAVIAGRDEDLAIDSDREDASHELRGITGFRQSAASADDASVSRSADPAEPAVSTGHAAPESPMPDDDDITDRLAQEGVDEAQHELMLTAQRQERRELRASLEGV